MTDVTTVTKLPLHATRISSNDAVAGMMPGDGTGLSGLYHCRSFTCLFLCAVKTLPIIINATQITLHINTRPQRALYALLAQLHGVRVLLLARLSIVLHSPSTQSMTPTTTRTMLDTSPTVIFHPL